MKRLNILFSVLILILALPFWRFADVVAIISPVDWPLAYILLGWFIFFLLVPLKLLFPRLKALYLVLMTMIFAGLVWWSPPLSKMASEKPEFNHCGSLTYTGTFYPIRNILSDAHRDDLEARNQLCWVRKLISKVPEKFDSQDEVEAYSKLIQDRLLRPQLKYRSSLPMIALLYFTINTSSEEFIGVKKIYDSLHFWIEHYTDEISARDYSVWNWPHSTYIKFEYGLVEKNWQELIDNIVVEESR